MVLLLLHATGKIILLKDPLLSNFIVQNKKGAHHIDGEHTVFGEVISGFATIDKIVNLKSGGDEWPLVDVFIKAEVIK